jgi:lipopolysaccharide export system protein LptA
MTLLRFFRPGALRLGMATAFAIGAFTLAAPVVAERADRDKPTTIDSDRLNHDDQKQITIFTGNVVLTKGTLVMRGDRMEMWQDPAGNYFGVMTGRPARFRQKRDVANEYMEGEAFQLDYDGKEENLVLTNNAIMRRLEGDVLKDQVSGDRLTYNNITERYLVESGQGQARSRMFLMPKSNSKDNAGAGAGAGK